MGSVPIRSSEIFLLRAPPAMLLLLVTVTMATRKPFARSSVEITKSWKGGVLSTVMVAMISDAVFSDGSQPKVV